MFIHHNLVAQELYGKYVRFEIKRVFKNIIIMRNYKIIMRRMNSSNYFALINNMLKLILES